MSEQPTRPQGTLRRHLASLKAMGCLQGDRLILRPLSLERPPLLEGDPA